MLCFLFLEFGPGENPVRNSVHLCITIQPFSLEHEARLLIPKLSPPGRLSPPQLTSALDLVSSSHSFVGGS